MTPADAKRQTPRNYFATNGLREPDWRWRLAMASVSTTRRTRQPDSICWHLIDFLACGDEWITALPGKRRFSIRPIIAIRQNRILRLSLEARVLAYRDIKIAATITGIDPQVAHDYCSVFFDASDRLHAKRAIDLKIIHAKAERDDIVRRELFWHAYFGGPVVTEDWLIQLPFIGVSAEHDLGTLEGRRREQIELTIASREPSTEFFEPKLLDAYRRLLKKQPNNSCSYAESVAEHVTDAFTECWQRTPTPAAREIINQRYAA